MTHPQTNPFVPLVSALPSGERRDFHITVIPQTEFTQATQAFLSLDKTSHAASELRPLKKNCEPRLSVQRDGDRITSIRIQCSCGQTIDLACVYEPPAKPA